MVPSGNGLPDAAEIIAGLAVTLSSIIGWMYVRLNDRVEKLETKALEDAKVLVTREELNNYIVAATEDRRAMHGENQGLLKAIFGKLDDHSELKEKVRRNEMDIDRLNNRVNNLPAR